MQAGSVPGGMRTGSAATTTSPTAYATATASMILSPVVMATRVAAQDRRGKSCSHVPPSLAAPTADRQP